MSDHEELLRELYTLESLSPRERLQRAKLKRDLQVKRWKLNDKSNNKSKKHKYNHKSTSKHVKFEDYVCLFDAITRRDLNDVKKLLIEHGCDPHSCNEDGITSLHQCCIHNSIEILKLLIEFGARVDQCDVDLWTPLHAAATFGNKYACMVLIENKANLLALNNEGNMPYDLCEDSKCLEFIETQMASQGITQAKIDLTRNLVEDHFLADIKGLTRDVLERPISNQNGANLLHIASSNGYVRVIKELLDKGVYIDPRDNDGWTPLHLATFWNQVKTIDLLIAHNTDLYARTNLNESILDLCDNQLLREFLIEKTNLCLNCLASDVPRRESKVLSIRRSISTSNIKDLCRRSDANFKEILYLRESEPLVTHL